MVNQPDIDKIQEKLRSNLLASGASFAGFARLSGEHSMGDPQLHTAIAIGIAYAPEIVRRLDSDIAVFERHLRELKEQMEHLLSLSRTCLEEHGFATWVPPISENLPGLLSHFSHKMAATRAGLGWIGKNSLLVSPEFGCGMRLATVLTNASFVPGEPITEDRCGGCLECVRACPYGAIKGASWYPGIPREDLLDAFLCSGKRERFVPKLGYKHPCGLCIQACPVGRPTGSGQTGAPA